MALVSDYLKTCGVKIKASVCGVPSLGSGVVYVTPNYCSYDYVLTAKHIFQEDSQTPFAIDKILNIEIYYPENDEFKRLQYIKKSEISPRLIHFDEDFAIVLIEKHPDVTFESFLVSDTISNDDVEFFSWGIFSANVNGSSIFEFKRNDASIRRFKLTSKIEHQYLPGMSGAGVFAKEKNVLFGIINRYPNEKFQNETIDCSRILFTDVNLKLKSLGYEVLDSETSRHKREVYGKVVDIHQAFINGVCLNLELARKRLQTDLQDDWYHDPLMYIDLLNQDYLFEQFQPFFNNESYEPTAAERFYVPKKQLTLRLGLISPFIDRIVYMATVGVLAEKMENAMISNVYSARYNRYSDNQLIINGVEQWKKMKYQLRDTAYKKDESGDYKYNCVIEIDLLNFYDNINKKLLIQKILRVCETRNEKNAADFLEYIITHLTHKELGLPQNSDASSLLASFYLNQVDVLMQHCAYEYYRFMDDIRIFCTDKYEARKILQTLEYELRRCDLSVNSQKTQILTLVDQSREKFLEGVMERKKFDDVFDIELAKIGRLRNSSNYAYRNQAFHLSISTLRDNLDEEDIFASEDTARRLNFALNTMASLGRRDIHLLNEESRFKDLLLNATDCLTEKPWITPQVYRVLNLLNSNLIREEFLDTLSEIVLNPKFNTYSFQTYKTWLLLAKHKCETRELKEFAVKQIEKNDDTGRAVIASMIIYMCSIDKNYTRVTLRKFGEGFTQEYFQNRLALISLRSFDTSMVFSDKIHKTLKGAHFFTNKKKNKDLVFIQGFIEGDHDNDEPIDQLYSI